MKLPQPVPKPFSHLMTDIESGQIKIPRFQRDFVWSLIQSAKLLDSIVKGYPIGTFIFWRTRERLRSVRDIGNLTLPEPASGESVLFVLDGQQRLTSLFAALKGLPVTRENGRTDDFSSIYIDLNAEDDGQIVVTDISNFPDMSYIQLSDLLYGDFELLASYPKKYRAKLGEYRRTIESYNYSIIEVSDVPIDIATEIFTRINVSGRPLTLFEIMVAKTYDDERGFDLAEEFDKLVKSLEPLNYETISDATVLQLISLILAQECKRQTILRLEKQEFIDLWPKAVDAIERAVEYFRGYYRIPVSRLLPYNTLIVPFGYYFYHRNDKPTGSRKKYLEDFFWRCALGGRYSSSVESKLVQDMKRIDLIVNDTQPDYDWGINLTDKFLIENGWFSTGRSYVKAILCIYAYQQPKSFNDNSLVNISNYWLKQANSKNYHHFFPRSYLRNRGVDDFRANHVLNITIVDDFLNKREIRAQPPSKYMKKFQKQNDMLEDTMKTHLIHDLEKCGIWDDDYERFLRARSKGVIRQLKKRIISRKIDEIGQQAHFDDYEEEPLAAE